MACLLFSRKRLTEHTDIVLLDEVVETLRDSIVDCINESLLAIHLLYKGHWNHSLSETLDFSILPVTVEFLLPAVSIILLRYRKSEFEIKIVDSVLFNFHILVLLNFKSKGLIIG